MDEKTQTYATRLVGMTAGERNVDPQTGEVLLQPGQVLDTEDAERLAWCYTSLKVQHNFPLDWLRIWRLIWNR